MSANKLIDMDIMDGENFMKCKDDINGVWLCIICVI